MHFEMLKKTTVKMAMNKAVFNYMIGNLKGRLVLVKRSNYECDEKAVKEKEDLY